MDRLTVEDFRCFGGTQTARLAPLTLLVGENSTGKTSFMAMASILWEAVYGGNYLPDFKKDPFDLGTFQDIVHEDVGAPRKVFSAGFGIKEWTCAATFKKGKSGPEVVTLRIEDSNGSVTWDRSSPGHITVNARTKTGKWHASVKDASENHGSRSRGRHFRRGWGLRSVHDYIETGQLRPDLGYSDITEKDRAAITSMSNVPYDGVDDDRVFSPPSAMAPIRSERRRTYERGYENISNDLASLHSDPFRQKEWEKAKQALENYGQKTELFEKIRIRRLGDETDSDPFQLQFRIHDGNKGSSWRNIVDVGYGVSQVLPVIVELNREGHPLLLLQQPEVHLHPRAQAGLGSILCAVAERKRQILVETHSDYLINRVRMDVRDRKNTKLKPEDVSILYFEREGPSVNIHDIQIDQEGNILGAPPSYRQFFMDEVDRDLGLL